MTSVTSLSFLQTQIVEASNAEEAASFLNRAQGDPKTINVAKLTFASIWGNDALSLLSSANKSISSSDTSSSSKSSYSSFSGQSFRLPSIQPIVSFSASSSSSSSLASFSCSMGDSELCSEQQDEHVPSHLSFDSTNLCLANSAYISQSIPSDTIYQGFSMSSSSASLSASAVIDQDPYNTLRFPTETWVAPEREPLLRDKEIRHVTKDNASESVSKTESCLEKTLKKVKPYAADLFTAIFCAAVGVANPCLAIFMEVVYTAEKMIR